MPLAPKPTPEQYEQLLLPRSLWYTLKSSYDCDKYRVMKGKREMPGTHPAGKGRREQCGPTPRVKIKWPGVYRRVCSTCGAVYWYKLEQTQAYGVLRFKWISQEEAIQWLEENEKKDVQPDQETS
jgi:hypothetical protein